MVMQLLLFIYLLEMGNIFMSTEAYKWVKEFVVKLIN